MIQTAISYIDAGLSVIPVDPVSKKPSVPAWTPYQKNLMTEIKAHESFELANGIAIICGEVSGYLEILDFDNKLFNARQIFEGFLKNPDIADIIKKYGIPYETTQSGGYHVFFRSYGAQSNQKLARFVEKATNTPVTVIETRGEGGYVIVAPSNGYKVIHGDLKAIPMITEEERDTMIGYCRSLNEYVVGVDNTSPVVKMGLDGNSGVRPGDAYNETLESIKEAKDLLRHAGWKTNDEVLWTRPGKETGVSATFGRVTAGSAKTGIPLFYVWSSNAHPFESEKSYTPFNIFCLLAHNNDPSAAARELALERGLGVARRRPIVDNKKPAKKKLPTPVLEELDYDPDDKKSKEKPSATKCKDWLSAHYDFRYDEVSHIGEMKVKGTPTWDTWDENSLYVELLEQGIKCSKELITSILGSNFVPHFDPFADYFASIHKWDGINHFSTFADYLDIVEDKVFFIKMLEKHFVRAIKCALEPSYYNRFVFVFRSRKQEIGKSRLIRLMNPFMDKYLTEEGIDSGQDSKVSLTENFIYSLEEIDDMKRLGIGKLKAFLAKSTVKVRLPYEKQKTVLTRRCSFFGSTNLDEFLTDDLNTRWLIFTLNDIKENVFSQSVLIQDMWAQAYSLYRDNSFDYELSYNEKVMREDLNNEHKQSTFEQDLILENFAPDPDGSMTIPGIMRGLATHCTSNMRMSLDATGMYDLLVSLGFEFKVVDNMQGKIKLFKMMEIKRNDKKY